MHFGRSTIEHWLYAARNAPNDPVRALERKVHARAGTHPSIGPKLAARIIAARPFNSADDLKKVSGIGDKLYARLRPYFK